MEWQKMEDFDDDEDMESEDTGINRHLKKHSSIIARIAVLVVFLFLVMVVIDPMTENVNESQIIYDIGSYPYNKVMDMFRDHPTDSDNDGLSDREEITGWDMESQVLSLNAGDSAVYTFNLKYAANYFFNLSIHAPDSTNIKWGLNSANIPKTVQSSNWKTISLSSTTSYLDAGNYSISISVESGAIDIDWIACVSPAAEYALSLDGGDTSTTTGTVTNMQVHVTTDPHNADSDYDGMLDGYEVATGVINGGWQDPMVTNNRYALLIAGGSTNTADNYPSIKNNVEYAYTVLHDFYGYTDKNIIVLSWDGKNQNINIVDGPSTLPEIEKAFNTLKNTMGPHDFLYVYITSHGLPGACEVYNTPQKHDMFEYKWLMNNLSAIHQKSGVSRMVVVADACNSGSMLLDVKAPYIITIASTKADDPSYTSTAGHSLFTHYFYDALEHPNLASLPSYEKVKNVDLTFEEHRFISVGSAFTIAKDKLKVQKISQREQTPQIDQNGDGIADDEESGPAYNTYI